MSAGAVRRFLRLPWWILSLQLPRRLREFRAARQIRQSGLFDSSYYLTKYPETANSGIDPVLHYVRHGAQEGRNPNPLFHTTYYLEQNPDVVAAGINPLVHFLRSGTTERRNPNPLFDTGFYLDNNPFVAGARMNPLVHYLRVGAASGRDPHPIFDTAWYLGQHPDVAEAGLNPLGHYLEWGQAAGRPTRAPRTETLPSDPSTRDPGELGSGADTSSRLKASLLEVRRGSPGGTDTAIVVHLFYPDLWSEIRSYLANIEHPFDLFVSLCQETGSGFEAEVLKDYPKARLRCFENRGRDIGPFIEFLCEGCFSEYSYVCKIHTKRSPHRVDGDPWRGDLLHQLLGSQEIIGEIRHRFDRHPEVGIIGPANQLDQKPASWGSNRERMEELTVKMGLGRESVRLSFFAGSMFWFRPAALEPLKNLGLRQSDFEPERGQLDGTLAHAIERVTSVAATAAGYRMLPIERGSWQETRESLGKPKTFKLIAFYLPQFHPIPENDQWWGKGFTEWSLAAKSRPLYRGHLQPRLPTELSFYDLRVPESRQAQADLARRHGIHGFCYYYYWFEGKRLLERPLADMLQSGQPDFPFCICWANENWTRRWDGQDEDVLMPQSYSKESSVRFIRDVIPILEDRRYIRYEGKPVLIVYRAKEIPDLAETVRSWRAECEARGVGPIHLCAVRFWDVVNPEELVESGFDAVVEFPPHNLQVEDISPKIDGLDPRFKGLIYDYEEAMRRSLVAGADGCVHTHRGVMLGWDNTARRGLQADIAHGATPTRYREWLTGTMEQERERAEAGDSLIFINAWNEWSEGSTLEPDNHFGLGYLEATRAVLREFGAFPASRKKQ